MITKSRVNSCRTHFGLRQKRLQTSTWNTQYTRIADTCFCGLQSIEQPKLTVRDVRRLMEAKPEPLPPPPPPSSPQRAIEYPVKTDPEPQAESPGGGEARACADPQHTTYTHPRASTPTHAHAFTVELSHTRQKTQALDRRG